MSGNALEDLAAAIYGALFRDLPLVTYKTEDYEAWARLSPAERNARQAKIRRGDKSMMPMVVKKRRPYMSDIRSWHFPQKWPSKSLGFILKNDIDPEGYESNTVIVECGGVHVVYFGGRLAYFVNEMKGTDQRTDLAWKRFLQNRSEGRLCNCDDAARAYQATGINRYGSNMPRLEEVTEES